MAINRPKRPLRHKLLLLLIVLFPFLFTSLLTAVHFGRELWIRLLFHPMLIQRKKSKKDPKTYGMAFENIVMTTSDGLHLAGWFIPAKKRAERTIIIAHGVTLSRFFFLPTALVLHKAGYNILMYDSRAHGASEGDFVTFGLKEQLDISAAIDYLRRSHTDKSRGIGVLAHSMGAAAAILCAVQRKEIKALVCINCYANIESDMIYWVTKFGHLPYWPFVSLGIRSFKKELDIDLKKISPQYVISGIKCPLFIINSAEDEVTDPQDSEVLYKKAGGQKEFWRIPKAKHENFHEVAGKTYERRLQEFFNKALG